MYNSDWSRLDNRFYSFNSLWVILGFEVDCAGIESLPLKFDPFGCTANFGEEVHRYTSVADHLATNHVFIADFDVHFVVHIDYFIFKELQSPNWMSTSVDGFRAFLATVNTDSDEGGHTFEETCVIMSKFRFFQVQFESTE